MAFRCPNCGGDLYYDITKKALHCKHCSQLTDVNNYNISNDAQEVSQEGTLSYICKNCGAELLSPDESIVTYCSYCGGEQLLQSRIKDDFAPNRIIPFEITKKYCKTEYKKITDGKFYIPKELKDPEFLEKFRGIYIPFWSYKVGFDNSPKVSAVSTRRSGRYVHEKTYSVKASVKSNNVGIPYDASSYFDDTSASLLMPFRYRQAVKFNPAYLAGFYADRPAVQPYVYADDAVERASRDAFNSISKAVKGESMTMTMPRDNEKLAMLSPRTENATTDLYPVWFLTWRNRNRVAYAIVNGQTGKLLADLPVDLKKYGLVTTGIAAAIFLLLTMLVSMTARAALVCCAVLTFIASLFFKSEVGKICDRENHIYDKGYFVRDRSVPMPPKVWSRYHNKRKKRIGKDVNTPSIVMILSFSFLAYVAVPFAIGLFSAMASSDPAEGLLGVSFILLIAQAVVWILTRIPLRYVKQRTLRLLALLPLLSTLATFIIAAVNPVDDYYYYGGCIICALVSALVSFGLIKYYNMLSTRPLPSFYTREGGNDNESDR